MNNVHLSNRCSLKTWGNRSSPSQFFVLSLFFPLSTPAHFSDWFNFFFSTTSVWPFYFYLPSSLSSSLSDISSVCAWLSPFSLSASLSLPLSSTFSLPPLSASFHLFLYLSQWELMWPLCAVSSLRGRQSSSAPIRTALSGAVSTTSPQKKRKEKKKPIPPSTYATHRSRCGKRRRREKKSQWH